VLSVSEKFEAYARGVQQRLAENGLRAGGDYRAEKIGAKIRDAQLALIPYMFVVGGREVEAQAVAVRDRLEGDLGSMSVDAAVAKLQEEIRAKRVRQVVKTTAGLGRGEANAY